MRTASQALDQVLGLIEELAQGRHRHEADDHAKRRLGRVREVRKAMRRVLTSRFPIPLNDVEHDLGRRIHILEARANGEDDGTPDAPGGPSGGRKKSGHSDPVAEQVMREQLDSKLLDDLAADLQAIYDEHGQAAADDSLLAPPSTRRRVRVLKDDDVDQVVNAWIAQHMDDVPNLDTDSDRTNAQMRERYAS